MDYKIAIPSHKRSDLCKELVLSLKELIPSNIKFFIFIENKQDGYDFKLDNCEFVFTNVSGIQNTRNYMYNFFVEGDRVVFFDDSFTGMLKKSNKKLIEFKSYHNLILLAFNELIKNKTILFGLNMSENPFFMTKQIQFGNYAISAKFHGVIIDKQTLKSINPHGLAEDQEISLRVTNKYGGVIRFGTITFNKPQYRKLTGGVQDMVSNEERVILEKKSCLYLSKKYETLCSFKKNGIGLKYKTIKK